MAHIKQDKAKQSATATAEPVLCVDLDGTLIATDMLWESLILLVKQQPWLLVKLPIWVLRGKSHFKRRVAELTDVDTATLPFRSDVLKFLQSEKENGREIVLATASDQKIAEAIKRETGVFSGIFASDGFINCSGPNKSKVLVESYGDKGFDYIGNGNVDMPIWQAARFALLVDPSRRLLKQAEREVTVKHVFRRAQNRFLDLLKAIRVHQWVKNLLIFVPVIMAHRLFEPTLLFQSVCAFFAFSLCASGIYVLNDLLDLQADRQHPKKKMRPFASGALSLQSGAFIVPALLLAAFLFAYLTLPALFIGILGLYFLTTTSYSFALKKIAVVDILILAGLYTLRIFAGGVAAGVPISAWLLAFSMFLFLSLAYMKRYAELNVMQLSGSENAVGRGYRMSDQQSLLSMGTASGYLSVLVLALYINSQEVTRLYDRPLVLWLICPLLLYWITRMWFRAQRGEIDDDPLVAAIRDPFSYGIGAVIAILMLAGVWQ